MEPRNLAILLAGGRLGLGLAMAAAPQLAIRGWIASHVEDEGARLMARAAGGRDVGLAIGLLSSLPGQRRRRARAAQRRQHRRWLEAAALADGVDLIATLAARRALPPSSLALGASVAAASTLAHLWLRRELG